MILDSFQPVTIITKCSILDVAAVLDPPLQTHKTLVNFKVFPIYESQLELSISVSTFFKCWSYKSSKSYMATFLFT